MRTFSSRQSDHAEHDILPSATKTQSEAMQVSVVIPAFNEINTIGEVIRRVLDCVFDSEVIVVDDASTDGSRDYLKQVEHPEVRCLFHTVNRGKGAALRTGFAAAEHPHIRARGYLQGGTGALEKIRIPYFIFRPDLPRRKEDRIERRFRSNCSHNLLPLRALTRATLATSGETNRCCLRAYRCRHPCCDCHLAVAYPCSEFQSCLV
jgi:Glycosyl transferase family 2